MSGAATEPARWTGADTRRALGIALVAALLRLPFQTRYAYSWDSANFVLAVRQFDPWLELPHGMGYIVYVWLGRLGELVGLPAHQAFLLWNLVAAAAGAALIYRLGVELWDRRVAGVAAVLFVTSPLTWFYAGVVYADIWDAALGLAVGCLAWRCRQAPSTWLAVGLAVCFAAAAGVRQQNAIFLFPLFVWAVWPMRWRARFGSLAGAGAFCLLWAVPLMASAGGPAGYLARLGNHSQRGFYGYSWSSWEQFLFTWDEAVYILAGLFFGCFLLYVALPLYLWHARAERPRWRSCWRSPLVRFFTLWIAPATLFMLLVHVDVRPGLTLGILPAVLLLTAAAASRVQAPPGRLFAEGADRKLLSLGVAANLLFFLALPTPCSLAEMRDHDRRLASEYAAIRNRFDPITTLLISQTNWYWYSARQAALHLPEYEVWYLDDHTPDRWWRMYRGRTETLDHLRLPAWAKTLVFIHDHRKHRRDGRPIEVDNDLVRRQPLPADTDVCWMELGSDWNDLIYTAAWRGPHPRGEPVRPRPVPPAAPGKQVALHGELEEATHP